MESMAVGKNIIRKDALDKASGIAKFNNDYINPSIMHCKMLISKYAHAIIKRIDFSDALDSKGVHAIISGDDVSDILIGTFIEDKPILAFKKVRYFGEPIAVVVASSEIDAMRALELIKIEYEQLPIINSPSDAIKNKSTLVHENLKDYRITKEVYPQPNTNIANFVKIRKGDMKAGWKESTVLIEESFRLPQSDHVALETRSVRAKIDQNGKIIIHTSSQSPYIVRKKISRYFNIDEGLIEVHTPYVGGAFGGKAAVQLELIAYLASKAVGGKEVVLLNSREEDMISSPCRIGLEVRIKLGASKEGILKAFDATFLVDTGAYSDMGAVITKAIASDSTGPYRIDNVRCDSICTYTNHNYVTSFRGFGHAEFTAAVERCIEKLAKKLKMDSFEIRQKNVLVPGDTSPTQATLTRSNIGNLPKCLSKLKTLINYEEGERIDVDNNKIRAKGISCFWKTSTTPPDAVSGAIITFSPSGHAVLNIGAVELGQGTKTVLTQILSERLKLEIERISVTMEVDTSLNPEHWKTVASCSSYMVGKAVIDAADDALEQIKKISAIVLRCDAKDLDVFMGKVYLKSNPDKYIDITEIIHGYKYPNGNSIGGPIIGRGNFIMKHLTSMDEETGRGTPGPLWTVGAQAIEVEYDTRDCSYKVLKAATVIDPGKVLNPFVAKSVINGGMSMGLSLASKEGFIHTDEGIVLNTQLRTYKIMRFSEQPEYLVEFVETLETDGPYGARGLGEHGLIGIPAALINSLSIASNIDLNELPLTPESIWRKRQGE